MTVLKAYAQEKKTLFDARARDHAKINPHHVFKQLEHALNEKIQALTCMQNQVPPLLYWQINECPEHMYCLDLAHKKLSIVTKIHDLNSYYKISAPAWQINKVLTHTLSWSDFALTLRVQLQRSPDHYHTLLHGFLILEPEKMRSFCETLAALLHQKERITIRANGKNYSILRYCPHQGADLSSAKIENHHVVCPRHHWRFDLEKHGQCSTNASGIEATCLSHAPLTPTK
jgi:UDP-MurNAc hydroxylase